MRSERESFDLLCKEGDVAGAVDGEAIERAETALGVKFPTEYRELLRQYGAVLAPGLEVYGLPPKADNDEAPIWQNVVSVTYELRRLGQVGTENQEFIPVSDDGAGVYFYLDTSKIPKTRILALGPGVEKEFDNGLFSFLVDLAEGKLTF